MKDYPPKFKQPPMKNRDAPGSVDIACPDLRCRGSLQMSLGALDSDGVAWSGRCVCCERWATLRMDQHVEAQP